VLILARIVPSTSVQGRLGLPHPSPLLGPPFEGTRSSLLRRRRLLLDYPAAAACWPLRRDAGRAACRQALSGQPRVDNHASPTPSLLVSAVNGASATCRLAHARRAWPSLQTLTATSLRTSMRRQDPCTSRPLHVPSTPLEPSASTLLATSLAVVRSEHVCPMQPHSACPCPTPAQLPHFALSRVRWRRPTLRPMPLTTASFRSSTSGKSAALRALHVQLALPLLTTLR
jgi:hypothetical protein